ncbi:MAG: helix-turn-helix domain-containing protein [Sphaerochaeta sp.]|jgi:excisionase family DNA binding protein|nr:helix-turn-helix domain-containing protein [Sphaerochaeta sp.]
MPPNEITYVSVKEAARRKKVNETTITRWVRRNRIMARRSGKAWLIDKASL